MKVLFAFLLATLPLASAIGLPTANNTECAPGEEFTECGTACPLTCNHVVEGNKPEFCIEICFVGCACKDTHALLGKQCIPKDQCKTELEKTENKREAVPSRVRRSEVFDNELKYGAENGPQDPKCPKNKYHRECSNICPEKTCGNWDKPTLCHSLRCGPPKCECKSGHVLSEVNGDECVPTKQCQKQ